MTTDERKNSETVSALKHRAVRPWPLAVFLALAFMLAAWLPHLRFRTTPPFVERIVPEITVTPAPVVVTHEAPPPDTGYLVHDGEGGTRFVPWPSPDVVQLYDADTFRADCAAVCSTPHFTVRDSEERHAGRVLFCQPEHLLCVCFNEGSSWPITRYVAWERLGG